MKFEKLFLEKYGHYENREIAFRPDAHLHVVLGRNEAGKSTALAAISDLLFGFDRRTGAGIFKPHYKFDSRELRIGAQLRFADGNDVAFRRRRGNKNTIVGADGEALGDDLLDPFLGGLDRATFEAEFGLTAERLRAGGDELLDAGGKLAETLAAGSAGLSALNQLKKRLQDEADGIFTPRKAAGKPFYAALDALDAARRALRDAIVTADAVAEAGKECARTEAARAALEEEHRTVSREVSKLKRIRQVRPMLARIAGFEEKLAGLGDLPPVAESATENWRKSFDAALETAEKIRLVQEKREAAANALAALSRNPALVEAGAKVADLREQLGARDKARKDIPNREAELHVEETQLDQAARDLGFDDRGKLLAAMPARPVLARVHAAVQARKSAALVRREKQENLERARQRQADLQRKDEAQGYLADPAPFAAELERFAEMPREAADLRRKSAELEEYIRDLEVRAARLQPPAPPLEDLARLALPDPRDIETTRRDQEDRLQRQKSAKENVAKAAAEIAALERKLANLSGKGVVATPSDLAAARTARDKALDKLQATPADETASREAAFAAVREAVLRLDMVTDSLLGDADRAAAIQALEQDLTEAREAEQAEREKQQDLLAESKAAQEAWVRLWEPSGIEPATPDAMREWLRRVTDILEQLERLGAIRASIAELESRLAGRKPALLELLERLGGRNARSLPAEDIHAEAHRLVAAMQKQWNERRGHAALLKQAGEDIARIEAEIATLDAEARDLSTQWAADMADICRGPETGEAEAEAALESWANASAHRPKREDLLHRIEAMQRDIEAFETGMAGFCAQVTPDLGETEPRAALVAIEQRLQESRQAEADRLRLGKEIAACDRELSGLEASRTVQDQILTEAAAALGVAVESFGASLARLEERQGLERDFAGLMADIGHVADNMPLEALRAEQADIDADTIDGELARLAQRAEQILGETNEAAIAARDAARAYDELCKGRNAAALAQEREEAAGQLLDISRRWLVRAAAARLAGQAIERHRRTAQDPAIARASELFAHATAGAFEQLKPDYGDNDELVFKAIRTGGESVDVGGLSDGTRDQLFLALRLALLERRAGEPLPFIGDDILTSFDEARTGQALEMLAGFGEQGQAILFSHHRHVGDIARERLGGRADVIEL